MFGPEVSTIFSFSIFWSISVNYFWYSYFSFFWMFPDGKIDFFIFSHILMDQKIFYRKIALDFGKSSNQVLGLSAQFWVPGFSWHRGPGLPKSFKNHWEILQHLENTKENVVFRAVGAPRWSDFAYRGNHLVLRSADWHGRSVIKRANQS